MLTSKGGIARIVAYQDARDYQKALDYVSEEENEDIVVKIDPFKRVNLVKVMKRSILTKRFYGQTENARVRENQRPCIALSTAIF